MIRQIAQRAQELGFDDCRFTTAEPPASGPRFEQWLAENRHGEMAWLSRNAAKRVDPQLVLPGARSIIILSINYFNSQTGASTADDSDYQGLIARYARFTDYHDVLRERLKSLTSYVNELGGTDTRSLWYVDTGPLLERDLAQRAGIGFVGKHTNLINRSFGNWLFLSEILTTLNLPSDTPERNRCGTCTRCLEACPTGAIRAPFNLDARLCISYLTIELKGSIPVELRPAVGNRIFGCDDCLEVCPWNRFAREGRLMRQQARQDLAAPDLLKLLELNEEQFKRRFEGTPLLRSRRRGLLRNVCVALGNVGDSYALPALERAATGLEPLIAEHARWAIERIKQRMGLK